MLPPGTVLTYTKAMPEGFTRYTLVVNVEGPAQLDTRRGRPGLVSPSSAWAPGEDGASDDELVELLRGLHVTPERLHALESRLAGD